MVYYSTPAEINGAFGNMVGRYDYASHFHHPDASLALTLAQLKPGQSVLDVGAGGGRFIAAAKQQVGNGFCVAVDAVAGFIAQDIPFMLQQKGLAVAPSGNPSTQVHCIRANINDSNFTNTIPRPAPTQQFDCIVAVHLFTTLPPEQRRPAYVKLRGLLKPGGRLVLNMSARFTDSAPLSSETNLPVQFRTSPHTESPGAHFVSEFRSDVPSVRLPGGSHAPGRVVTTLQTAPDRLWAVAVQQARNAAMDAGFVVQSVHNIGKGDGFGLPAGQRSPSTAVLNSMTAAQWTSVVNTPCTPRAYNCIGRGMEAWIRRNMGVMSDVDLVKSLQHYVGTDKGRVLQGNASLPPGALTKTMEFSQVGVMMVLTKL